MSERLPSPEAHMNLLKFYARIQVTESCWLWTAGKSAAGYGIVCTWSRTSKIAMNRYAHRVAYELIFGPIPSGMVIDHLCRTRHCVNPTHMEPVTSGENSRRGLRKIRCIRGHNFTDDNSYWRVEPNTGKPGRQCKECHNIRQARYKATARLAV